MSIAGLVQKSGFKNLIPDKLYLAIKFRKHFGYWMSFRNPRTFNEKLQWLKLYDRRPEYTTMVDKYAVKKYVADILGEDYVIPTYGVWERGEDIEWDKLPSRFVLKCSHDSGGLIIVKDKTELDIDSAVKILNGCLKRNYYTCGREWPYKNVPHRIIAEKYMEDESGELRDYKFFCFDGQVKALFIATERQTGNVKFDFFDAEFNHLDFVQEHPMSGKILPKPDNFEEMKTIASRLSQGIPHVRVDLYSIKSKIYFGEMTFCHHGGSIPFHPVEWDYIFGSWINLPSKTSKKR